MSTAVTMGAMCQCSMGMAPSSLIVLPLSKTLAQNKPMASIMDNKPMVNILTFGMCRSPANPTVAAATAAAMGTLTPMPCVPMISPWLPGNPKVLVANKPALTNTSKCMCAYAGVISIVNPGCFTVQN